MARFYQRLQPILLNCASAISLDLQKQVAVAIVERRQTERADLKAKLTALAAEAGLSLDDVFGLRSGSKALAPPKYRNQEKPEETWAGRGRKPLWLVAELQKRGATKSKILQSDWSQQPHHRRAGNHSGDRLTIADATHPCTRSPIERGRNNPIMSKSTTAPTNAMSPWVTKGEPMWGEKPQPCKEIPARDAAKYPDDNVPNDPVPAAAERTYLQATPQTAPNE